jgi:hypothetical protein
VDVLGGQTKLIEETAHTGAEAFIVMVDGSWMDRL